MSTDDFVTTLAAFSILDTTVKNNMQMSESSLQ